MATIAKTVGSFDKVLASCKTIGAQYQPNATELSPIALSQLAERAQQSLRAVTVSRIAYRMAVNNRKDSFAGVSKLAVRIVRMMAASSRGESSHLEDAVLIKNKFYTPKKSKKSVKEAKLREAPALATRSSARWSFDQQMETFSNLVELAEKIGNYNPNEAELALEGLKQKLADLHKRTHEVALAHAAFKKGRHQRDEVLYGKDGIHEITKAVKDYIHGAFGPVSPQSEQITGR